MKRYILDSHSSCGHGLHDDGSDMPFLPEWRLPYQRWLSCWTAQPWKASDVTTKPTLTGKYPSTLLLPFLPEEEGGKKIVFAWLGARSELISRLLRMPEVVRRRASFSRLLPPRGSSTVVLPPCVSSCFFSRHSAWPVCRLRSLAFSWMFDYVDSEEGGHGIC